MSRAYNGQNTMLATSCSRFADGGRVTLPNTQSNSYRIQPASPGPLSAVDQARFWLRVNKTDTCWLWMGPDGRSRSYGRFSVRGRIYPAHRIAYELVVGQIPPGLPLDHLCRVPACVNPSHLEPVTHYENVMRGVSPFAARARQTHCKYGHELTEENITRRPSRPDRRECRICYNARQLRLWHAGKRKHGPNNGRGKRR